MSVNIHFSKVTSDSKYAKEKTMKRLKEDINNKRDVVMDRKLFVYLPKLQDHKEHFIGQVRLRLAYIQN